MKGIIFTLSIILALITGWSTGFNSGKEVIRNQCINFNAFIDDNTKYECKVAE